MKRRCTGWSWKCSMRKCDGNSRVAAGVVSQGSVLLRESAKPARPVVSVKKVSGRKA